MRDQASRPAVLYGFRGSDLQVRERVSWVLGYLNSVDYLLVGVDKKNKLKSIGSVEEFYEIEDPNFLFIPEENMDAFMEEVDSIKGCRVTA